MFMRAIKCALTIMKSQKNQKKIIYLQKNPKPYTMKATKIANFIIVVVTNGGKVGQSRKKKQEVNNIKKKTCNHKMYKTSN